MPVDSSTLVSDEIRLRFQALILERTGLAFDDRRRFAVVQGLLQGVRETGSASLDEYYLRLQAARTDSPTWEGLLKSLTVCETYFFRDPDQMAALRQHILPELIQRRSAERRLRIWSAGCASGEEPYTLAIILRQLLPDLARWDLQILGTDINHQALRKAAEGLYTPWSFRQIDILTRQSFFTPDGPRFAIKPEVLQMVRFNYLNLSEDSYPSVITQTQALDLILCRNVMIYLPEAVSAQVVERFGRCLAPGGWLVVGASDMPGRLEPQFQLRQFERAFAYQKAGRETIAPGAARPAVEPVRRASQPAQAGPASPRPTSLPTQPAPLTPGSLAGQNSSPNASGGDFSPGFATGPAADLPGLLQQSDRLLKRQQTGEARQLLQAVLQQNPTFIPALLRLARLEANAGRPAEALRLAGQAVDNDPLNPDAHFTRALVCLEMDDRERAAQSFKKVVYLNPDFLLAHLHLYNLLCKAGQPQPAARHRQRILQHAARLDPNATLYGSDDMTAGQLLEWIKLTE